MSATCHCGDPIGDSPLDDICADCLASCTCWTCSETRAEIVMADDGGAT